MAAGSDPIRASVRPSTLSTLFFITALGLVPIVTGTTDTDRIADSLPGVQSRNLHGVPTLPQLVAPSPPQLAPLSRRALQTVQPSDTDRHLTTSLVHSQLASSPPQQLGSSQLDSSPSPQLSSSPSPQLCSSSSPQLCSSPLPQLSSSPSPQLSSSPSPQPQSDVQPHHDDEWANSPWLPGLFECIILYALVWVLWLGALFYPT